MPATSEGLHALTPGEARVVAAMGQTLFPRDRLVDVDARDAGVVAYIDDYAARLPGPQRFQLKALLRAVELGFGAWALRPSARFSAARPGERERFLDEWSRTESYPMRQAWYALKGLLAFAYVDAPEVQRSAGYEVAGDAWVLGAAPEVPAEAGADPVDEDAVDAGWHADGLSAAEGS